MELDELKTAWRTLDERVNNSIALNLRIHLELRRHTARVSLRRLAWLPSVEVGLNAIAAVLNGMFLAGHLHEPKFIVPALVVQAAAVILIIAGARQLTILSTIDYAAPVVDIQRRLAALDAIRVRVNRWVIFSAALLWLPIAIVLANAILGLDLYQGAGARWLAINFIVGLAVLLVAVWISRRYADRFRPSSFLARISDDLAGRNVARAIGALRQATEFANA
jgi:hypothetical protein